MNPKIELDPGVHQFDLSELTQVEAVNHLNQHYQGHPTKLTTVVAKTKNTALTLNYSAVYMGWLKA